MRKSIFFIALIAFIFFTAIPVCADISPLARNAGVIEMMQNNNVRMVEDNVYIQVYEGWSVARCEYIFKNESQEAQDVLMGIPASKIGEGSMIDETTRLQDLKIYDNGIKKEGELEKTPEHSNEKGKIAEWHTWTIHFKAGEERKIVNTYKVQNRIVPWGRETGYFLSTEASWKGIIDKAVITFEFMDISPYNVEVEEYNYLKLHYGDKNKIIWEMENFEPMDDIGLSLFGYWSTYSALCDENNEQGAALLKEIEQTKMLFINGYIGEGLRQANHLFQRGIYAEEIYFCLLNYYHKQGNIDEFIRVLKEEIQHINDPYVLEWASVLYPDRLEAEGIIYPEEHKPIIKNQAIRKLNEIQFELTAEFFDQARDICSFNSWVYTDALSPHIILESNVPYPLFGFKNYDYQAKGNLQDPYSDLIWQLEISDYKGDSDHGMSVDYYKGLGMSMYFYTGGTFEQWNVRKDSYFTICYYDKSFDSMESEFRENLNAQLQCFIEKLGINIPVGGYTINLYNKVHMAGLKKDSPQNITKCLKRYEYEKWLCNGRLEDKNKEEMKDWNWGEVIAKLDANNRDKMIESIHKKILIDQFGTKWQDVNPEIASAFISAVNGEPGEGSYYEVFSSMTKDELKKAAQDIGMTGKTGKYETSNGMMLALIMALALLIYSLQRWLHSESKKTF